MEVLSEHDQLPEGSVSDELLPDDVGTADIDRELEELLVAEEVAIHEKPAYFTQVNQFPLLSAADEVKLAKKIKNGDEAAYVTFFQSNLRLVLSIARDIMRKNRPNHLDLDDLVMEGNLELMDAIGGFDPKRGCKFSTYAYPRIWGAIRRSISDKDRIIHIPINIVENISVLDRRERKLEKQLGRQPTAEELAGSIGLAATKLARVQRLAKPLLSIDAPDDQHDESGRTIGDKIEDEQSLQPEREFFDRLHINVARDAMAGVLAAYNDEERHVFEQYYGIGGHKGKTFAEIGAERGWSKDKARQIHHKMVEKFILATRLYLVEQGFAEDVEMPSLQEALGLA